MVAIRVFFGLSLSLCFECMCILGLYIAKDVIFFQISFKINVFQHVMCKLVEKKEVILVLWCMIALRQKKPFHSGPSDKY